MSTRKDVSTRWHFPGVGLRPTGASDARRGSAYASRRLASLAGRA